MRGLQAAQIRAAVAWARMSAPMACSGPAANRSGCAAKSSLPLRMWICWSHPPRRLPHPQLRSSNRIPIFCARANFCCCGTLVRSMFGGCRRFPSPADSLKQGCPSACRSSDRTGEKPGSYSGPTPTNRQLRGTSANRCRPDRSIAFRLRDVIGIRRTPINALNPFRSSSVFTKSF